MITTEKNILGTPLEPCCTNPLTGFYRTGYCEIGPDDLGVHAVCIEATSDFLEFSKDIGNDLSTPRPEYNFPGVKPGDCWCLCASRWQEAFNAGCAPLVKLKSTHHAALLYCNKDDLLQSAVDLDPDLAWQAFQNKKPN